MHWCLLNVDEMPGLQALERIATTIPMQPGQPKRIEYEYKRHGTLCMIGNWHVVEGKMISPTIKPTRTESDFAWHIFNTVQTGQRGCEPNCHIEPHQNLLSRQRANVAKRPSAVAHSLNSGFRSSTIKQGESHCDNTARACVAVRRFVEGLVR